MSTKPDKTAKNAEEPTDSEQVPANNKPLKCGIIMPIADNPDQGYPLGHWGQVRDIVIEAAESAGFKADMVSNDTQVDLIHATIIKNIYANDVAVCDVSSRNPNVMFELGLRIASKKPVILIKDETTPFSFDTQLIPHLAYRRDLRLFETLEFQKQLRNKIEVAHQDAQQKGYKSFLEQFTSYTLAQISEQQVDVPEYIMRVANQMQSLENTVKQLSYAINKPTISQPAVVSSQKYYGGGAGIPDTPLDLNTIQADIEQFLVEHKVHNKHFNVNDSLISNIIDYVKNKSKLAQYMTTSNLYQIIDEYLRKRKTVSN